MDKVVKFGQNLNNGRKMLPLSKIFNQMKYLRTRILCVASLLITTLLLSSCMDDLRVEVPGCVKVGFYAGGEKTRTTMLSNGLSAEWVAGDQVAVWALNSSGSYAISNQIFTTYGLDASRGFFSSTLNSAMPEGLYTYFCCYPLPLSVNGTQATFSISSEQDGKASNGVDIMVATPTRHSAMTALPDPEDHSGMSMSMNRMMHQFRFWMPVGYNPMGEDVLEIITTMPYNIAGRVSADISDPTAGLVTQGGTNTMTLVLADPIGESANLDNASFACASVIPYNGIFSDSDYMNLVLYSKRYKATLEPISLSGRTFAPGHSTPVRLLPTAIDEYYRLTMKVRNNNIGEPLLNVQIAFNGGEWYRYTNSAEEGSGNFKHIVEALGTEGKDAYDLIVSSIESGVATYTYETEHALVTRPLTADMMTYDGNRIVLDLGDVPYLLYEDFSNARETAHDDDYTAGASSDRNYGGYLLDGYMPLNGWNASRFRVFEGDYIRVNCRYQSGGFVPERVCGRLDTPALKYIKSGVTVNVAVEFDKAFYVPAGYYIDDSNNKAAHYIIATHTNSEGSSINGENYGDIDNKTTRIYQSDNFVSEGGSNFSHVVLPVPIPATSSTRITFWPGTTQNSSKLGANSIYYLYLDNIKVYINN